MPYYDYRCSDCSKPARLFFSFAAFDSAEPTCPSCQSNNLRRRIGRIAVAKGDDARMDGMMDERSLAALENEDPREMARVMKKMSQEMGEGEAFGDDFGEVVDRLEKGQTPDQIEKAMPELDDGGSGSSIGGLDNF